MSRVKKSRVWEYFEKIDNSKVKCNICKRDFKFSGNTSNLHFHLRRKHLTFSVGEKILENLETEEELDNSEIAVTSIKDVPSKEGSCTTREVNVGASTSTSEIEHPKKKFKQAALAFKTAHMSETRRKKIDRLVIEMICKDFQPISVVEDTGFKNLIQELEPRYSLPSRRTIGRTLLPDLYSQIKTRLLSILRNIENVAITTDIWTSANTQSYLTLTCHFILYDDLKSYVITTTKLSEQHTGPYLANVMKKYFGEWGISKKISAIVSDNAANIRNAIRILNYENLPCTAHTLNLVVNDILKDVPDFENILKTCRAIVGHFKMSVVASDKFIKMQQQMNIDKELKLKQDVVTRWNSSLSMIERMLLLKEPLSATMVSLTNSPQSLNNEEWAILEDCVPLLKPLEMATAELSADSYVTLSVVIPLVRALQMHILSQECSTTIGQALKNSLLQKMSERLAPYERRTVPAAATFMDPRFKKLGFGVDSNATAAENFIKDELTRLCRFDTISVSKEVILSEGASTSSASPEQDPKQKTINFWQSFDNKVKSIQTQATPQSSSIIILKSYNDMVYENRHNNPLLFWTKNKQLFPELFKLAKKYLCVPATSVPAERIFSKAGLMTKDRRNRIKEKNLDYLIFINKNYDLSVL